MLTISEDETCTAPGPGIFLCDECGDCFSSQGFLDKHIQDAHAWRPKGKLECSLCPYNTNDQGLLVRHEQTHSTVRPFPCPSCCKSFRRKTELVKHQRVHTGEKPYKCGICGQQFSSSFSRDRHRKLHLDDDRPHACRICGRAFRDNSNLRQHLATHTGGRRHECRVCGQKFSYIRSARQHERQVHGGNIVPVDSAFPADEDEEAEPK
ncbi:uncharacterized protein LOC144141037 [Haemaphysalis longicornis]